MNILFQVLHFSFKISSFKKNCYCFSTKNFLSFIHFMCVQFYFMEDSIFASAISLKNSDNWLFSQIVPSLENWSHFLGLFMSSNFGLQPGYLKYFRKLWVVLNSSGKFCFRCCYFRR